jgi:hypothetical protein
LGHCLPQTQQGTAKPKSIDSSHNFSGINVYSMTVRQARCGASVRNVLTVVMSNDGFVPEHDNAGLKTTGTVQRKGFH